MPKEIRQAVAILASKCKFDEEDIMVWMNPLLNGDDETLNTLRRLIYAYRSEYPGRVEVMIGKNGKLSKFRFPDGVNGEQLDALTQSKIPCNWQTIRQPRG